MPLVVLWMIPLSTSFLKPNMTSLKKHTLLQANTNEIGMNVDLTLKCHPELEGEGIERMWACIKNLYRRKEMIEKRGKEMFISAVKDLLNFATDNVKLSRKFSKKARSYMISHDTLDKEQPDKPILTN